MSPSKRKTKSEPKNVLPFPQSSKVHNPYDSLAKNLESRLNKIESDLKDSLSVLESDVEKLIKTQAHKLSEKDLRDDLENLAKTLEQRLKSTFETALKNPNSSKSEREELGLVKEIAKQFSQILSFDFFKSSLSENQSSFCEVDEFGMDPLMIEKFKPLVDFLYFKYWRVKTTGINNIPNDGKALVVGNHSGTVPYDGSMLAAAIFNEHPVRNDARFLVENFVYHMPILGSLMYRIGGVRACPENAERLLSKGHLVIVFPEGVKGIGKYYQDRYKLQRFGRGGFIKICIATESPLIPVGIVGAEEIHPILFKSNSLAKTIGVPYIPITPTFPLMGLLGLIPLPSKWSIHFGKPIHFEDKSLLEDEIGIHKNSEMVRSEIQNIILDLLKKRQSVWTG